MTRITGAGRPVPTYPERGATARTPLPSGYHHLRRRTRLGAGRAVFEAAGTALTTYAMHRAMGMAIEADHAAARPGGRVGVGLRIGPVGLYAPTEVVWTAYEPRRIGFAYGSLPGHPECGEEAFVVSLAADDTVWFEVLAFSRPAAWWTRLAGPLVPFFQRRYAAHCGRVLRRLARQGAADAAVEARTSPAPKDRRVRSA
ncbi:DUF1990 family protein [Streptomyces sp. BI20]|uniref:DUF1990 family protein n=1 Tax=Streptomyces sp. BI20 TaxID=3403460 RepID=UPI003C70F13B